MGRREFSNRDILRVLQTGNLKPGKADGDGVKGVFRVFGYDSEGNPLAVVIEIDEKLNRLKVITGFEY